MIQFQLFSVVNHRTFLAKIVKVLVQASGTQHVQQQKVIFTGQMIKKIPEEIKAVTTHK